MARYRYHSGLTLGEILIFSLPVWLIIGVMALAWYAAGVEADVWNRCHPGQHITQWEALWTNTRIDQCDG
jgi:hypothetical protein